MTATIKDIAKELGITHSTVSRALNGKMGVSPELRQTILNTAERLGYSPNAMARGLVTRQSNTIAVIVPDFSNPFFVEIAHEISTVASARGYTTILCDSRWDHREELLQIKLMAEKRVDGIIIKSFGDDDSYLAELDLPVVKLNPANLPDVSSIDIDNALGSFQATEHLIQGGYQHIAYIGSTLDPQTAEGRYKGYVKALAQSGREVDERLVCRGVYSPESGATCYASLRSQGLSFDAALCENDMIALGVLDQALQDHQDVPAQFGVVGFDDLFFAGLPMFSLTTVAQPKRMIGEKAATLLLDLITRPEETPHQSLILKPELVVRSTTRSVTNQPD